ncbi:MULTISPECIES: hypothetical protein [unclassified Bradyrhizobium]|uniref:hypothetical protein n=1 Tax=unclassified Bradyrhizobium TaxID=2631580 RepID=UPI001CD655A1|nr:MULTISPECIES: hypothetical protein [unclassified Bradyrhizobium]
MRTLRPGPPSNGCSPSTWPNCPGKSYATACCGTDCSRPIAKRRSEAALRRIDLVGIDPHFEPQAEYYTQQNALSWRTDPIAATEIEARLAAYGCDQDAVTTEVYIQAREVLVLFEGLLNAPQTKRTLLLREIRHQRFVSAPMRRPCL